MICSMCQTEFDPDKAVSSCDKCVISKGCTLKKCPNCGYENIPVPDKISFKTLFPGIQKISTWFINRKKAS